MTGRIRTIMTTLIALAAGAALCLVRSRKSDSARSATSTTTLIPSEPTPSASASHRPAAPVEPDTPTWLRVLLVVELIGAGAYLIWRAFDFPFQTTRTDLSASLASDALLVFLIVIAIDGFDPRSITREQRWLMSWIARPAILLLLAALLLNMLLPVPTPVLEMTQETVPFGLSGTSGVILSIAWAFILWALVISLTIVAVIALNRLKSLPRSARLSGRPPGLHTPEGAIPNT